ncbi:UDP-3-O-(3-hydroxymyristoyl)glucosamine N-acyltransferase, partial [bacterium]|nr:UDP-3-O-(3-hydroxymyristoyl)glucosamine N-acyltransferase [bacterium]
MTGDVPGTQQLRAIAAWLDAQPRAQVFSRTALPLTEPRFTSLLPAMCGLLAVSVSRSPGEYLMWFRPERLRTLVWGGNPEKAAETSDDPTRLSPRRSFAQWQELVRGTSDPWTNADLTAARLVGGVVEGDENHLIHGVADLAGAGSHEISFFVHPRYEAMARQTKAGALVVGNSAPKDLGKTRIRVTQPSAAFTQIAALFAPPASPPITGIHPTAVVSKGALLAGGVGVGPHVVIEEGVQVGEGTQIGAGCYVGRNVRIGDRCVMHPRVYVGERCVIGHRVVLHAGAVVGADGFGYEMKDGRHIKVPQLGYVQIDDDAEIGANTTIDRGRFARTHIGEGAKIDNLVMIAHNCVVGPH